MEPCLVSWKVMRMNAKASRWKNEISQKQNTATEWLLSLLSSLLQLLALDVNQEVARLEEPVDENRHAVEEDRGWEGERDKHALAVEVLLLRVELVVRGEPLVSPLSRRDGRHWKNIMTPSSIQGVMDVQRTQKMTACRVSLPLVRKMTALVTRWKAARPWIQCSRQSSWRIKAVSRIPLQYHLHLHWQNISKGRQSLSYWSPLRGDPLVWMTYLCNKMKDLRSQGLGLIFWLHQDVQSVLFLRQMGILLSINRFCSFDVQLVQLKSDTLNSHWNVM